MYTRPNAASPLDSPDAAGPALPPYVFTWLDGVKAAARARGASLIDLGIGNPDQPTPQPVIDAIGSALADPGTHGYPPFRGTPRFLAAAARYLERRFGVRVDPEREILALSGAKEGIAQLYQAILPRGRARALVPGIHYPVHARAVLRAGGAVDLLPLTAEGRFLPELDAVPEPVLRAAGTLLLNYPHNPTGAVATRELYERAVEICTRFGITLISDLAYAEITFDGYRAPSVLQVPGAREVAIEFHSLSKSFNMAGSRIAFATGAPELLDALYETRMDMGYGTPAYIQEGAVVALDDAERYAAGVRALYEVRRDRAVRGFRELGWEVTPPRGAMFLWLPVPHGFTSAAWTEHMVDAAGVVVTPGHAFGPDGEGFFRVSLVADEDTLDGAFARLREAGIRRGTPRAG